MSNPLNRRYRVKIYRLKGDEEELYLDRLDVSPEGIQQILNSSHDIEYRLGQMVCRKIRSWINPPKRQ